MWCATEAESFLEGHNMANPRPPSRRRVERRTLEAERPQWAGNLPDSVEYLGAPFPSRAHPLTGR